MKVESSPAGELWRQASVVDAVESYAQARVTPAVGDAARHGPYEKFLGADEEFWAAALRGGLRPGARFAFEAFAFTEWVARAPGLYWKSRAQHGGAAPVAWAEEAVARRWRALPPIGKSARVAGGVGTLRLQAADGGARLCSITAACNASVGIPVLVTDEMLSASGIAEGSIVRGQGVWQGGVPREWRNSVLTQVGLPSGCLRLTDFEAMAGEGSTKVLVHPFSVMEYESNGALLYDFVYADMTADTPEERQEVAAFFDAYAKADGRRGRYLLGADAVEPIWEARYPSPEALRERDGLEVLRARIEGGLRERRNVEALVRALTGLDGGRLAMFAADAGVPEGWRADGLPMSALANRLAAAALEAGQFTALVTRVAEDYPAYWADAQG